MVQRMYSQTYRTEASDAQVGVIEFIVDDAGAPKFLVRIKQGNAEFDTLPEAEAWLQKREAKLGGSKVIKG